MHSDKITRDWNDAQDLPPRQKYAALRKLCNDIVSVVDHQELNLEQIDLYTRMLNSNIRVVGFPERFTSARAKLVFKRLALLGINPEHIQTIAKKVGTVNTESACIGAGDPSMLRSDDRCADTSTMTEKRRLLFGVGADGKYRVELRIVNCSQPVLTLKEYKQLSSATDIVQINVPAGIINVSDSIAANASGAFSINVEAGLYNLCAYLLMNRAGTGKHLVIAAKAESKIDNLISEIPSLDI